MFTQFKEWLKKSGIVHFGLSDEDIAHLNGTEMIDSLNPLDAVIEDSAYPMARIYRESVWTGVKDTFHVIMGNHFDIWQTGSGRKGVLDYLTLGVTSISRRLVAYAINSESKSGLGWRILAGIVGMPLEIGRGILGILFTLALSPVVLLVHLLISYKAYSLRAKVNKLKIVPHRRSHEENSSSLSVHKMLEQKSSATEAYTILAEHRKEYYGRGGSSVREISRYNHKLSTLFPETFNDDYYCLTRTTILPRYTRWGGYFNLFLPVHKDDQEQREAIEAFKALNIGGRRNQVEKKNKENEILKYSWLSRILVAVNSSGETILIVNSWEHQKGKETMVLSTRGFQIKNHQNKVHVSYYIDNSIRPFELYSSLDKKGYKCMTWNYVDPQTTDKMCQAIIAEMGATLETKGMPGQPLKAGSSEWTVVPGDSAAKWCEEKLEMGLSEVGKAELPGYYLKKLSCGM